jgi:hypothetical protein
MQVRGYGRTQNLEVKAAAVAPILNMSVADAKTLLSTKSLATIASEKGVALETLSTAVRSATKSSAETRWKAMGLSESEIATRKARMAENQSKVCDGSGTPQRDGNGSGRGMGRGK